MQSSRSVCPGRPLRPRAAPSSAVTVLGIAVPDGLNQSQVLRLRSTDRAARRQRRHPRLTCHPASEPVRFSLHEPEILTNPSKG